MGEEEAEEALNDSAAAARSIQTEAQGCTAVLLLYSEVCSLGGVGLGDTPTGCGLGSPSCIADEKQSAACQGDLLY